MDKQNKLNAKDLINVGIYTAMYLVVFFVIGMLNAFPIFYPISLFVSPLITGVPFMLFTTKIKKSGMIFIMAVILGCFGYIWDIHGSPCNILYFQCPGRTDFQSRQIPKIQTLNGGLCYLVVE